ncbi:MAG: DUF998 domain-containing protein [Candidatus Thorarchaeota archaeon]|nr:MAG: DUF998 domain-containing protein [Candidatus Thorarchaeota archaeon]
MTETKCPNCDGKLKIPKQSSTVVCEYCNTTVNVKTGKILKENYFMKLQYDLELATEKMFSWGMKQLGAPKGLNQSKILTSKLVFWPFWVVEVEAKANYTGVQKKPDFKGHDSQKTLKWNNVTETGKLEMEQDIFIPANPNTPKHLKEYIIPTKRKEYFNRDQILEVQGITEPVQMEQTAAIQKAKETMSEILRQEALKEVDSITQMDEKLNTPAIFLVSIPIWHIKYCYKIRNYEALVDGASGRIIHLKYPRKMAFRAMTLLSGLLHLAVGGGIGLLLVYLGLTMFDGIFPTIFGIAFGLGMLAISLRFFRTAFSLRAGMEEAR